MRAASLLVCLLGLAVSRIAGATDDSDHPLLAFARELQATRRSTPRTTPGAPELKQAEHMEKTFTEIVRAMGGVVLGRAANRKRIGNSPIEKGGRIIHEVGGAIMGEDAKKSVTNQWCQTWDIPNLYLTDGAPFVGNADKNPTLTIMALAWRAADHMLAEMKKGSL